MKPSIGKSTGALALQSHHGSGLFIGRRVSHVLLGASFGYQRTKKLEYLTKKASHNGKPFIGSRLFQARVTTQHDKDKKGFRLIDITNYETAPNTFRCTHILGNKAISKNEHGIPLVWHRFNNPLTGGAGQFS